MTDKNKEIMDPGWLDIMSSPEIYSWSGWRGDIDKVYKDRVKRLACKVISECFPRNVAEIMAEARQLLWLLEESEYEDLPSSDIFHIFWGYKEMKMKNRILADINGRIIDNMYIDMAEEFGLNEINVEAVKWCLDSENTINIFIDIEWSYEDKKARKLAVHNSYYDFDLATIHAEIRLWD